MADSNIGSLPQAQSLDDSSLLVAEQQGQAVKVTGAQFKEFGKTAVISQVQGYVDQAKTAAEEAVSAVSAVTDMTVEAHNSETASVAKTIKNGKVNLDFGLPRGQKGETGPAGATGPRGPQGPTGKGLTILGYYDTLADLQAAVPSPSPGDAYGVGLIAPYNIYVYDGVSNEWKDNGQLSGGGGGVLPDDVVTADGGAEMTFSTEFGNAPHTVTFTEEEEPPLTAEDVRYRDAQNVKQAIDGLKSSVSSGKALVASAITDKGVTTAQDATFAQMAENIEQISGGSDTSDATATSFDILAPKTAYTAAGKVEGTIPTLMGQTITPGTADKTIANGQYLGGTQIIKGDPNLTSGNIKSGVTLFGVEGSLENTFQATLTVTADTGAVVTATHTDGTEVSALSQTGTVVLELPKEGTWKVTAVRGVAQYNTVTIEVSSQYSAALTAEVHIEYYGEGTNLSTNKYKLGATNIGNYVLFAGTYVQKSTTISTSDVDVYDLDYTKTTRTYPWSIGNLSAGHTPSYAVFAGGCSYNVNGVSGSFTSNVVAFSKTLVRNTEVTKLSTPVVLPAVASVGEYVLFAGGTTKSGSNFSRANYVNAYNDSLTKCSATDLTAALEGLDGASNQNYAIFAGGYNGSNLVNLVFAYNSDLTRTLPTGLSSARYSHAAARAGNYVLFAGGATSSYPTPMLSSPLAADVTSVVDAYDLFLTRTTVENLALARADLSGTTLSDFAMFAGGQKTSLISSSYRTFAYNTVDIYDPYLTHTEGPNLSGEKYDVAAVSNGSSAFFGGGRPGYHSDSTISVLSVNIYRYV